MFACLERQCVMTAVLQVGEALALGAREAGVFFTQHAKKRVNTRGRGDAAKFFTCRLQRAGLISTPALREERWGELTGNIYLVQKKNNI